ncbi:hypothetical protein YB2330_000747 [Saitoella coloradoensis]
MNNRPSSASSAATSASEAFEGRATAARDATATTLVSGAGPRRTFPAIGDESYPRRARSSSSPTQSTTLSELLSQLDIESKIKEGAENLLVMFEKGRKKNGTEDNPRERARRKAEHELDAANMRIAHLKGQVESIQVSSPVKRRPGRPGNEVKKHQQRPSLTSRPSLPTLNSFQSGVLASDEIREDNNDSPTWSLSDILQTLEETHHEPQFYVDRANTLVRLLRRHPLLKYDLAWSAFGARIQWLLGYPVKEVSAAAYRVARHAMSDLDSLQILDALQIELFIIKTLAKESKDNLEREQAVKLVRLYLDVPRGTTLLPRSVVRAVVAVAEHTEDKLANICIETLAELLMIDPALLVDAGGMRILLHTLTDGPAGIAQPLITAFMYILDSPHTRKYIHDGADLDIVLSAFTEAHAKAHVSEDRLNIARSVVTTMLKSWPGLFALCMDGMRPIRSLIDALRIPASGVRVAVMDLVADVLGIKDPSWTTTFLAGRRITMFGRPSLQASGISAYEQKRKPEENRMALKEHFEALLLCILFDVGLLDALQVVIEDRDEETTMRKATLLIGELLQLAGRVLPLSYSSRLSTLERLFEAAVEFGHKDRFVATSALMQIESFNRIGNRPQWVSYRERYSSSNDQQRGQRQVEQVKIKMNLNIDDTHFRNMVMETQVPSTKNFTKWNWDTLLELVQGPLRNPKRLEESIRASHLMRRLISFFKPFKFRYSNMKKTKPNQRYTTFGCALLKTLLSNQEGIRYLTESKLVKQIAECLSQLEPVATFVNEEPVFSRRRMEDTLSSGYFALLGTLSSQKEGITLMEHHHIFNMCYHISDLKNRDDLMIAFVENMDYSLEGHSRIILSKALTTGSKAVRMFATKHLASITKNSKSAEQAQWALKLLTTQLYDPFVDVCEVAVRVLEEACDLMCNLQYVVKLKPALDHLGEIGAPLMLRFLSTSIGFQYLNELDYIGKEMDDWFHGRNESYVALVEACLAKVFSGDDLRSSRSDNDASSVFDGTAPPHFYGELAKTEEGCRALAEKGHFQQFCNYIRAFGQESQDEDIILKVKSCLWAVGNIGSTAGGAPFICEAGVAKHIVQIAATSKVMSLKGTAYFVLGAIVNTERGAAILGELGWETVTNALGLPLGLCVPDDLGKFLTITRDEPAPEKSTGRRESSGEAEFTVLNLVDDPVDREILAAISGLSNHILANEASRTLAKLKSRYGAKFGSPSLYKAVLYLLEVYRYRLPVRRFLMELFKKDIIQRVIDQDGGPRIFTDRTPVESVQPTPEKESPPMLLPEILAPPLLRFPPTPDMLTPGSEKPEYAEAKP